MDEKANITRYVFSQSRTGEIVPAIYLPDGSIQPLHSMIDPKREAHRLVSAITEDTGFLIFLGLGGGFAPQAALHQTTARIVVIDFDKKSIEELFAAKDYSELMNNSRFSMLIDPSFNEIKNFILEQYNCAVYGGIKVIPLRTRIEHNKAEFEKTADVIQEAIKITGSDFSVQVHFGKRWFSNIIRNIINMDKKTNTSYYGYNSLPQDIFQKKKGFPAEKTAIIAAGPSLDHQLTYLKELKSKDFFLISSDTALPVILHNGIEPDAVVSIDCQHISYYHFLGCNNEITDNIPLILDIASPPALMGFSKTPVFFSSGHPLALYIGSVWRKFFRLDTSGGNVTYACLSLAEILEAQEIVLFGADFAYIENRTYARGTYLNPYFSKKQNRISAIEAQMSAFLYRSPFLPPETNEKQNNFYETSSLRFYRKKLEEKASAMNSGITCAFGFGAPINLQKTKNQSSIKTNEKKSTGRIFVNNISGRDFLENYKNDIKALPDADKNNCLPKFNLKENQIFTTLLPYAASIKNRNTGLGFRDLLSEVKLRSVMEIEKVLNLH